MNKIPPMSPFEPVPHPAPESYDLGHYVELDPVLADPFSHVLRVTVPPLLANGYRTVYDSRIADDKDEFVQSIEHELVRKNPRGHLERRLFCDCFDKWQGELCKHFRMEQEEPGVGLVPKVEIPFKNNVNDRDESIRPLMLVRSMCDAHSLEVKAVKVELTMQAKEQLPPLLRRQREAMVAYDAALYEHRTMKDRLGNNSNNGGGGGSSSSSSSGGGGVGARPALVAPPFSFVLPVVPNVPQLPNLVLRDRGVPPAPYVQAPSHGQPLALPKSKRVLYATAEISGGTKTKKGGNARRVTMTTVTDAARFGFAQQLGLTNGPGGNDDDDGDGDGDGDDDDDDDNGARGHNHASGNVGRSGHAPPAVQRGKVVAEVVACLLPKVVRACFERETPVGGTAPF